MIVAQTSTFNDAPVKTDIGTNTTSGWEELRKAAQAVLLEADRRSESKHPMRYTCPWRQLTRLRKALERIETS